MKKYLVVVAVTSLLLSGCGKNDEPEMEQAGAETAAETGQPTGTMTEAPAMAEEPATEVSTEAQAPMTEEAAPETAMETPAQITEAPMEEAASAPADTAMGMAAYKQICFACHDQGVAGAPKLGDKAAWAPRIAQGMETLVSHAINGFQGTAGVMPPKGGLPSLSDEQVSAAVAYMVEQSQ